MKRKLFGTDGVIRKVRESLGDGGRVVVRYSGTEMVLRVMVEGVDEGKVKQYGADIADTARKLLGARVG